ncbi:dihydrodipicolinate synthase family protein [Streptomyces sp. NPDC004609]|uniref:dihydrodipicolinate synthase family protein n=1 Tax=Streptomyces sp. NPDC004609 TaxID=3364704 RepID=UPI0036B24209
MTIHLPGPDGTLRVHVPRAEPARYGTGGPLRTRTVFAAAHVVADPRADTGRPDAPAAVDWDATLAFRRHLWSYGLGVAEAMDTAQRGMGLDWPAAAELIRRSAAEARAVGGRIVCGVGTDQLTGSVGPGDLSAVRRAYEEQLALVEETGARAVLMASRALAAAARTRDDYLDVYGELLRQAAEPVVLHWLGPMFDPALAGYWGGSDRVAAADTLLEVVSAHPRKVDGVKISLLDPDHEIALRRRLPAGVRCYTGDDFHYPELIAGDGHGFSHALLGVFDLLAPLAAHAVRTLDEETSRGEATAHAADSAQTPDSAHAPAARGPAAAPNPVNGSGPAPAPRPAGATGGAGPAGAAEAAAPDPKGAESTAEASRRPGAAGGTRAPGRGARRDEGAPPPGPAPTPAPAAAVRAEHGADHAGAVAGTGGFRALLDPTVELARHLFQPPTRYYKTGVVLLAWLAGHQSHFTMVGGLQSARSLPHLARAYELSDGLGLFPDPALAEARMASLLTVYGVDR